MRSASLTNKTTQNYENLVGAEGKKINFRPQRFKASELFSPTTPDVIIGGKSFTLDNISLNGLAFRTKDCKSELSIGEDVPLSLFFKDTPIFSASVTVVRKESSNNCQKIAVKITDKTIDINNLKHALTVKTFTDELQQIQHKTLDNIDAEYKLFCADIVYKMRQLRHTLDNFESEHPNLSPLKRAEILDWCQQSSLHLFSHYLQLGNALTRDLSKDRQRLKAYKSYTETIVTPELLDSVVCRHAYEKPFGYPGDRQVMRYLYEQKIVEKTLYQSYVQSIGFATGSHVVTRMNAMEELIRDIVNTAAIDTVRICNVGSGICFEVAQYLKQTEPPKQIDFTLIEQDEQTLAEAYNAIVPLAVEKKNAFTVSGFHTSFMAMIDGTDLFVPPLSQTLLYSVGTLDYLSQKRAKEYIKALYARVAPGGYLVVSNLAEVPEKPTWFLTYVLDWNMIYRTREDMVDLASNLNTESVDIQLDPSGKEYFMTITKPL